MFYKKPVFYLLFVLCIMQTDIAFGLPSMQWIKKNIMDFSPLSFFIDIKPQDEWLDADYTYKNKLLYIAAHSCRGVVPTVGSKIKKTGRNTTEILLGKKNQWGIGPAKVSSKTVAYVGVNGAYTAAFAKGTLRQKVLYAAYKIFVRKLPSRYITKKFLMLTALLGINNACDQTAAWWIGKDNYCHVFSNVAKKAVKSTFELIIQECLGCYIEAKIYG